MKMIKSVLSKLLNSVNFSQMNTIDEGKPSHEENLHTLKRALPEGLLGKSEERKDEGGSVGKGRGEWIAKFWAGN